MSTNQQQNQEHELEQLQSLDGVGDKTLERLKQSNSYSTLSDVAEADPIELKETIQQNCADALWIRTQLRNSDKRGDRS